MLRKSDSKQMDREIQRQQAQDDVQEEIAEHQRRDELDEELAPEVERLDPQSVPGLYPEFEGVEDMEGEVEEVDDSWYVDSAWGLKEEAEGESEPLWKRRAAANLGRVAVDPAEFATGSLFDMCFKVLSEDAEVSVLDVSERCEWTSRMLVAEAKSTRHMRAMTEGLLKAIKERNKVKGLPLGTNVDGRESDDWMVVDLGSFVVHVMTPEARKTYDLEKLWAPVSEEDVEFVEEMVEDEMDELDEDAGETAELADGKEDKVLKK
ncbi:hypothetical protein GGI07_003965 [Coemansia sp. Benny D115]|nr:hypothetical protein GGI07_003965 [Coemansia sp. Benny D115]